MTTQLPFAIRNPSLLTELVPYLVCTKLNLPHLNLAPFGMAIDNIIDPLRMESEVFLRLLHRLDGLTFGPEGMPMPRWVFFDCAELPGAIYGLARPAATLWPKARELFKIPADYTGLVPVSMYVAIPMPRAGAWFGHNLSSLAPVFAEHGVTDIDLRGLGSVTKGLGLKCFQVRDFWGATQWLSKALYIHVKFGPLRLSTAYTPAHSEHETLTYGFAVTDAALRASMGDPTIQLARPKTDFWIDASEPAAMIGLQDRIESGQQFVIPDAPRATQAGGILVPITQIG